MVSTVTSYADLRNRASVGTGFDGVVRVSAGGYYGTGVLLYDGQAVLTAAHLLANTSDKPLVHFETTAGTQTLSSTSVLVHPGYDSSSNNDLALVWLSRPAPLSAERYTLYRSADEIGQVGTLVGYGRPGTGASGAPSTYTGDPIRQKASNLMEADTALLKRAYGSALGWTPLPGSQLMADFDSGQAQTDALGLFLNIHDLGLGASEGVITPGDSGGPLFMSGKVAGIASYSTSLNLNGHSPDADGVANGSYGELAVWQRVGYYEQWIDQNLRKAYANAPTRPEDVQKNVPEGNSGTSYAYFLVQFTGTRSSPDQVVSVDYSTRDGSAKAGQDYVATTGVLKLYPGEDHAVVPVEIVGDNLYEPDEVFYLDVTHPVGGSFGQGIVTLTAMRTIVNDDPSWS